MSCRRSSRLFKYDARGTHIGYVRVCDKVTVFGVSVIHVLRLKTFRTHKFSSLRESLPKTPLNCKSGRVHCAHGSVRNRI